jgi:glutamyl-tRNA synthetase
MHVGNARTALFNALLARKLGGRFVLRIEDTDAERSRPAHVGALQEDLRWLGLHWDEGPEEGGPAGAYSQSDRGAIYAGWYRRLEQDGGAYPCFCSESRLAADRRAQVQAGRPPRYVGRCRELDPQQAAALSERGIAPTLRFRVPDGEAVEFDDLVRGPQRFDREHIGDFIIRRSDGTPAFFFSNAVDDAAMAITHVLRGEDHLANTPRQILLLQALGLPVPRYGHLALIVGDGGAPLSKRHGAAAVADLRREGYLAAAVLNHLARLGHTYDSDGLLGLDDLAAAFDTKRLGRAPAHYDEAQLRHWQQTAVQALDDEQFWRWIGAEASELVPRSQRAIFFESIRPNVSFPGDALSWARVLFSDDWALDDDAAAAVRAAGEPYFLEALAALEQREEPVTRLRSTLGLSGKRLFQPLRAALTGRLSGPELGALLALIPPGRVRKRLEDAVEMAKGG